MAKLIIRSGPQAGTEYPMDRSVVRLGRGSGSDIVLPSSQLSRQHAEISQQGDQFFIQDLGSTNGTFVNGERISGSRPLRPGDQVQLGDITLAFDMGAAVPMGAAAAGVATDWESELWDDEYEQSGAGGGKKNVMIWVLGGVVAILLIAIGVGAFTIFGGKDTPTPEAGDPTVAPTSAVVVVVPSATQEEGPAVPPTETPLVDLDLPTVEVDVPAVDVDVPAVGGDAPAIEVPKEVGQALPTGMPVSPENLEQLPAMVTQFLGDVPPDQLPQLIGQQMQSMSPEDLQAMIGSLFPGVDPAQLPQVIAASFPGLPQSEIEALLGQVFPGQTFQLPEMGAVGGRIALGIWGNSEDDYALYIANALGGQPDQIIDLGSAPSFTPDGQWLVYHSGHPERLGLRLVKADGSEDSSLTDIHSDYNPFFSRDGTRILFFNYDHKTLHTINRDGTDRRSIGQGEYPTWSPDGTQIVYRGCVGSGTCGLIVANSDGSNPVPITTHANDAAPRWSSNGGQIAFHSDRDGNWEIYVINSDGSWLRRITLNPTTDMNPVWSPDGLRIAFRSDRGGQWGVWATSGVGGGATKLFDANTVGSLYRWGQLDWGK